MANYFVIGGDNQEYGPVSADDLRRWITEGRVAADGKVRAEGSTEWVPLSAVPELSNAPKAAIPPRFPVRPNPPAQTGTTSAMAVLSLVLGILGLFTCGVLALFGLILGIIALVKISNSGGTLRGKGLALAGVIVSGVLVLMLPIFAAMLLPALSAAHTKAREISCMNNEKQLALAVRIYAGDHAENLPPATSWCDAIEKNLGTTNVFNCPAVNGQDRCDYAFNARLDGLNVSKVNPQTVLIFESDTGWNAHGGPEIGTERHGKSMNVAFVDGHVERVQDARLSSLRWDP